MVGVIEDCARNRGNEMTAEELVEWRIRLYGHNGKALAAEALGISVKTYSVYERGTVTGMFGIYGRSVPRLVGLACMAIEAGLDRPKDDDSPDERIVDEISVRAKNLLLNAEVPLTVSALSSITDGQLSDIPGMGKASIKDIRQAVLKARQQP